MVRTTLLFSSVLGWRFLQTIPPDTFAPEVFLIGDANVTEEGGIAWQEIGYEAHDARDGNITDKITITGMVDENVTGDYIITYLVSDAAGNEGQTLPVKLPLWTPPLR